MPKVTDTVERVRTRAMELGVYLPLGAYATVRDQITDLNGPRARKLYTDLVDRGQDRLQPVERAVRRRSPGVEEGAAPKKASELPIKGYGDLTAAEIVERLEGLSPEELEVVRRYEADTKARTTVLEKIDSLI